MAFLTIANSFISGMEASVDDLDLFVHQINTTRIRFDPIYLNLYACVVFDVYLTPH